MNGILLIDKPSGISSFGVVARVRKAATTLIGSKVKVGHAGTLDPFASGLLILLIGKTTKSAGEFLKLDKSYDAIVELGKESTTADPEGEFSVVSEYQPKLDEISMALSKLKGNIMQVPPIYSAIKVDGKRAYHLARRGQEFQLKPREVSVYDYQDVEYEYPFLSFNVSVSSGTYIRSLAVDMGKILKTGAYLKELRRTSIGKYKIAQSTKLEYVTPENISNLLLTET